MDTLPRQTLSQTVIPPTYSSKGPFVIPQNHLPKRRCPPLFPIRRQFKCEFYAKTGGATCFPLGLSHEK